MPGCQEGRSAEPVAIAVDWRLRRVHARRVDFDTFHRKELPARLAIAAPLALPSLAGLAPFTFLLDDGRAYHFSVTSGTVAVNAGVAAEGAVLRLPEEEWLHFASERWTRYGLLYHGHPEFVRGDFTDLCRWEPGLRALFHGRPVYDPDTLDLREVSGNPLELQQVFDLDADDAAMQHFLDAAGYVHVRDVFSGEEVEALRAEVESLAARATPGDPAAGFWTRDTNGKTVITNLKYGALGSELLTRLHHDPRIERIVALAGRGDLRPNFDRNEGTKIIFKRPGATEGLVDLPLHTDCGMGYHPIACPMYLVGVHLDDGTPASGQLHVVAGSHRTTTPDPTVVDVTNWPIVPLDTQAGDCSLHISHVLHAAPPPVGTLPPTQRARRTAYLCFAPPPLFEALAPLEDLVGQMSSSDGVTLRPESLI